MNKGTTPKVCAIFAASSDNWRTAITKVSDVFLPFIITLSSEVGGTYPSLHIKYLQILV